MCVAMGDMKRMAEIDIVKKVWYLFGIPFFSFRETVSESELSERIQAKIEAGISDQIKTELESGGSEFFERTKNTIMEGVEKQLDEMMKMFTGRPGGQNEQR